MSALEFAGATLDEITDHLDIDPKLFVGLIGFLSRGLRDMQRRGYQPDDLLGVIVGDGVHDAASVVPRKHAVAAMGDRFPVVREYASETDNGAFLRVVAIMKRTVTFRVSVRSLSKGGRA